MSEQQPGEPRADYIERMRRRGEHVLGTDCWCRPRVVHVEPKPKPKRSRT